MKIVYLFLLVNFVNFIYCYSVSEVAKDEDDDSITYFDESEEVKYIYGDGAEFQLDEEISPNTTVVYIKNFHFSDPTFTKKFENLNLEHFYIVQSTFSDELLEKIEKIPMPSIKNFVIRLDNKESDYKKVRGSNALIKNLFFFELKNKGGLGKIKGDDVTVEIKISGNIIFGRYESNDLIVDAEESAFLLKAGATFDLQTLALLTNPKKLNIGLIPSKIKDLYLEINCSKKIGDIIKERSTIETLEIVLSGVKNFELSKLPKNLRNFKLTKYKTGSIKEEPEIAKLNLETFGISSPMSEITLDFTKYFTANKVYLFFIDQINGEKLKSDFLQTETKEILHLFKLPGVELYDLDGQKDSNCKDNFAHACEKYRIVNKETYKRIIELDECIEYFKYFDVEFNDFSNSIEKEHFDFTYLDELENDTSPLALVPEDKILRIENATLDEIKTILMDSDKSVELILIEKSELNIMNIAPHFQSFPELKHLILRNIEHFDAFPLMTLMDIPELNLPKLKSYFYHEFQDNPMCKLNPTFISFQKKLSTILTIPFQIGVLGDFKEIYNLPVDITIGFGDEILIESEPSTKSFSLDCMDLPFLNEINRNSVIETINLKKCEINNNNLGNNKIRVLTLEDPKFNVKLDSFISTQKEVEELNIYLEEEPKEELQFYSSSLSSKIKSILLYNVYMQELGKRNSIPLKFLGIQPTMKNAHLPTLFPSDVIYIFPAENEEEMKIQVKLFENSLISTKYLIAVSNFTSQNIVFMNEAAKNKDSTLNKNSEILEFVNNDIVISKTSSPIAFFKDGETKTWSGVVPTYDCLLEMDQFKFPNQIAVHCIDEERFFA